MKIFLTICCSLVLFSCRQKFDDKTYEENKVSIAQKESSNPQQFLKLSSDYKKNIFGATIIKGKIVNTASVAVYKNTRIKTLCFKNGIRMEEHEDVMPDIIQPGGVKNFKMKYHFPKGTDSLALSIMSADTVNSSFADSKK